MQIKVIIPDGTARSSLVEMLFKTIIEATATTQDEKQLINTHL